MADCIATKQLSSQIKRAQKDRPWQRYDECRDVDDTRDLMRNPYIIAPLYDEDGERSGEIFFAGGAGWDDLK